MQSYKVLEAHLGDRFYSVGDTRVADPNNVGHLVKLGLLEEMPDVAADPVALSQTGAVRTELERQNAALTLENETAKNQFAVLAGERVDALARLVAVEGERDAALARILEVERERDDVTARIALVESERDAVRVDVETVRGDLVAARDEIERMKSAAKSTTRGK